VSTINEGDVLMTKLELLDLLDEIVCSSMEMEFYAEWQDEFVDAKKRVKRAKRMIVDAFEKGGI
jgi:hypothetical protein